MSEQIANLFNAKTPWNWGVPEFIAAATLVVLAGWMLMVNGLI